MTTTAPTRTTHPCPVTGCPRPRVEAQNMCSAHWASIPPNLLHDLLTAWDAIEAAWPKYIAARNAALATVAGAQQIADLVDLEALAQLAANTNTAKD